ncbi:NYN domain-containing protein [Roseomonas sp. KE2513]|uniref:NYN domain-containing protein n=1 Tax=Roseomonas sp. KE2513 TaxID=2479202 RepID=UPI0018DF7A49|nr:NYN domain-containing protein [Roseomonas sp. KE2513]
MNTDDLLLRSEAVQPTPEEPARPTPPPRKRAALYVDGFNLYHSLDDLKQPHLKWLNIAAVARLLVAGRPEDVVRIVFCTAIRMDDPGRIGRHRAYVRALEGVGVVVLKGYFAEERRKCRSCGATWMHPTEKEGDTSLSITVIDDAHRDRFDVAYLITADGDQAPVARMIRDSFPDKELVTVAPPGRSHNYTILSATSRKASITEATVERSLFDRAPRDVAGNLVMRPREYDPPAGWVPPHLRPRKGS